MKILLNTPPFMVGASLSDEGGLYKAQIAEVICSNEHLTIFHGLHFRE